MAAQASQAHDSNLDDVGVLSLRDPPTIYLQSSSSDHSTIAASMVEKIEEVMQGSALPSPHPEDRPVA
jgi:hypothetical protein